MLRVQSAVFTLRNPSGLHARPATVLVHTASSVSAAVTVCDLDRDPSLVVDARSILGVLSMGASAGHRIRVSVTGGDEAGSLAALADAIESGLGEGLAQPR